MNIIVRLIIGLNYQYIMMIWKIGLNLKRLNGNGIWDDAEQFTDENGNGIWDSIEEFIDKNGNGIWDGAEQFTDENGNGIWDDAEEYIDENGMVFGITIHFIDKNCNSIIANYFGNLGYCASIKLKDFSICSY